jgi:uncharacterized protein (TIGR03083 family)
VTPGDAYQRLRRELLALVDSCDADALRTPVPATPAWTVRDVLAHVVGIAADLNAERFGDGDADAWTAAQVDERRCRSVKELSCEWDAEAPRFLYGFELFGDELGGHYVADLAQHVVDVQEALGRPVHLDAEVLEIGLGFYCDDLDVRLREHGVGLMLELETGTWQLGVEPPKGTLRTGSAEAFRVMGGRRSVEVIRALAWDGDRDTLAPLLPAYPPPA